MSQPDVLIVGAGLAGLCCARELHRRGVSFQIVEASDGVGGRMRTDSFEDFRLDRGFQVLLTAYPEAKAQLDYEKLGLFCFESGALIRKQREFTEIKDPYRHPGYALPTLLSSVGTLGDKLRVARLRSEVCGLNCNEIFARPEITTLEALRRRGFTPRMIESFFRPFYGGILLDETLGVSSRMFEFVFKMLSEGETAIPRGGIQAIPDQLAAGLPKGSVRLNARVHAVERNAVRLTTGERLRADAVVVATEGPEAAAMLPEMGPVGSRTVSCLYYAAAEPPHRRPILLLNGGGSGPVNNLCVLSEVAEGYAPAGTSLISVTLLHTASREDTAIDRAVRENLREWYGSRVTTWRLLKVYRIPHALPAFTGGIDWQRPARITNGLYVAGDHRATPSIQGAMESGRKVAELLMSDFAPSQTEAA